MATLRTSGTVFARTGNIPPQASGSSATVQTYVAEQRAVVKQWRTLVSQGAGEQQMQAWQQQNAPQFQPLQQMAQQLSPTPNLQPRRMIQQDAK